MAKHILSILVENHAGVLSKVAGLFSRRGFNIDSLAVGVTEKPDVSRITIVVNGDDYIVDQVSKQLNKLVDVITVKKLEKDESVSRELVFLKVKATTETRSEIVQLVEIFRANIVDVSMETLTIEITGANSKIKAIEDMLQPFGIIEIVRTGSIAIGRGDNILSIEESE